MTLSDYVFNGQLDPARLPFTWVGPWEHNSHPEADNRGVTYTHWTAYEVDGEPYVDPIETPYPEMLDADGQVQIVDGAIYMAAKQRETRRLGDNPDPAYGHYWYGLRYRSELSTKVPDPLRVTKGLAVPGYAQTAGDVVSMRLRCPAWTGLVVGEGDDGVEGVPQANYAGFRIYPIVRLVWDSDDRAGYDDPETYEYVETNPGTHHFDWEITAYQRAEPPPPQQQQGMVARLIWRAYSHVDTQWNEDHWTGWQGGTFPFDPDTYPYIRTRMVTDTSVTFERSTDGVTWVPLYPPRVDDHSHPKALGHDAPEASRDGVIDVPGVANGHLSVRWSIGNNAYNSEPSAAAYYSSADHGAYLATLLIDHLTITSTNRDAVTLGFVRAGGWVPASALVAQDTVWDPARAHELP